MAEKTYDLSFLRTFLEANPQAYKELGVIKPGRPKGAKNKPADPVTEITPEQLTAVGGVKLTADQVKQLTKKKRAPRNLSEEQKAKMLENLRKGRERLNEKRAEGTVQRQKTVVVATKEPTVPVQPIKPRKQRVKKAPVEIPLATSDDDTFTPTETSDTEPEVKTARKRFQKRKALINSIDAELSKIPVKTIPIDNYTRQLLSNWR